MLQRPLSHEAFPIDSLDSCIMCVVLLRTHKGLTVDPVVIEEPNTRVDEASQHCTGIRKVEVVSYRNM